MLQLDFAYANLSSASAMLKKLHNDLEEFDQKRTLLETRLRRDSGRTELQTIHKCES